MPKSNSERQYRCSPKYYDRLDAGPAADLEVGDRVQIQHGGHIAIVRGIREFGGESNYKLRKRYQCELLETGQYRWLNRDQVAYLPTKRLVRMRAESVQELWTARDRYERSRWSANNAVGMRMFSTGRSSRFVSNKTRRS